MSNSVSIPHSVPVPLPNRDPQNQNNGLLIGVAVAAGILLLILFFVMFRGCGNNGIGNSGSGAGDGTQGISDGDGGNGNSTGSEGTSKDGINSNVNGADEAEQKAGIESAKEETNSQNSSSAEQSAPEQGDTGEKQTESKQTENNETETDTESKAEEKPKENLPQQLLVDKLSGSVPNTDEPEEDKDEPKQGGGFLGKGDAEVSFFGAKGKGSKFIYVIDHSGSMSGSPLEEAKKEMLNGLDLLKPHHKFNVIFYDHHFISWIKDDKLLPATDKNKKEAKKFINGISAAGGTEPTPALVSAVNSKPEHIFFLTDGEFSMNLEQMCAFANKNKVHINVIQFGGGSTQKSPLLQELAKKTNGDYRFIDVSKLDAL
jgi:hypothetical protein